METTAHIQTCDWSVVNSNATLFLARTPRQMEGTTNMYQKDCFVSSLYSTFHLQGTQSPGGKGGFPTGRERAGRRCGFRLPHEVDHRGTSAGQGNLQALYSFPLTV